MVLYGVHVGDKLSVHLVMLSIHTGGESHLKVVHLGMFNIHADDELYLEVVHSHTVV